MHTYDRHGNERDDPITLSTNSPQLTVTAGTFRTGDLPARVAAFVANGALRDTILVSVVPPGVLVVNRWASVVESLVMINTDGSGMRELISDHAAYFYGAPEWSADGATVIYKGGVTAEARLVRISLTGGTEPLVTTGVLDSGWPSASNDGEWIYFSGKDANTHHLWRIRPDGTQLERVSDPGALVDEARPSASADGTLLAYESNTTVMVRNLNTGTVTTTPHPGTYARFSPVGDRIAYLDPYNQRIALTDPDGSNQRFLTAGGANYTGLDWSPDAKWIVTTRDSQLLLIEVATGSELPLRWAGAFNQPSWRP